MNNSNNESEIKILEPTEENLLYCAEKIKEGGIVGFPTETVYGLGASALNTTAVKKIFEYKGRPLSDPLIVHVTSVQMAKSLIKIDDETQKVFELLADKFWPGPLTIVVKANFEIISPILTANTECIGIRYPNNEIAKRLIDYSGVPIAAPSANKFCHVSPVDPYHVFDDFKEFPISIINGGVCSFRMESTVIKINSEDKKVQILRMGAISPDELESFLFENKVEYKTEIFKKINQEHKDNNPQLDEEVILSQESPGQFVKHYSPELDTYIFDEAVSETLSWQSPRDFVFLDFNRILFERFQLCEATFLDLSESGNPEEVMLNLYNLLHKAEKIPYAKTIILCDLVFHMSDNPHKQTLVDRILKAAANKRTNIKK